MNKAGNRFVWFAFFLLLKALTVLMSKLMLRKTNTKLLKDQQLQDEGKMDDDLPITKNSSDQNSRNDKLSITFRERFSIFTAKAIAYFSFGFFLLMFEAMLLDIIVPSFVNIKFMEIKSFLSFLNILISLTIVALSIVFLYTNMLASIHIERLRLDVKLSQEEKDVLMKKHDLCKWVFIKEDLKEQRTFFSGILVEIIMIKDFLVALFIVGFVEYPVVQLTAAILLFSGAGFLQMRYHAFRSRIVALPKILNELVYLLVCSIFLLYQIFDKKLPDDKRYNIFGFGLLCIIGAGVLLNIVCGFIGLFVMLISRCSKKNSHNQVSAKPQDQSLEELIVILFFRLNHLENLKLAKK